MRENKFRALSSGKWWYSDDEAYVLKNDNGVLKLYEDESFYNNKDIKLLEIGEAVQYTGLTDKNGKEIYKSDLIKSSRTGLIYEVVWDDENAQFTALCTNPDKDFCLSPYAWKDNEIIGNIYEDKIEGES